MASHTLVRCFVVCFALGGLVRASFQGSDLLKGGTTGRLEKLKEDLVEAKRRSMSKLKDEIKAVDQITTAEEAERQLSAHEDEVAELMNKQSKDGDAAAAASAAKSQSGGDAGGKGVSAVEGRPDLVEEAVFYHAQGLYERIKEECAIDLFDLYKSFTPVTLSGVNDARVSLLTATKHLTDTLTSAPDLGKDLKDLVNSADYADSKVSDSIDKTLANIEQTLSAVQKEVFCAEAKLIAARIQMTIYGGSGFSNSYMCNKVFVEIQIRHDLNATRLLKAARQDKNFLKEIAKNLTDDIACYEKELEVFNVIVPTAPFTAESPLQLAAFTSDFLIGYGNVMLTHNYILWLEADIIQNCANEGRRENDRGKKELEEGANDTDESLTHQLQKLLKRLNEVSEKKKAAEAALIQHAGVGAGMPSAGQKTAMKDSFYKQRSV